MKSLAACGGVETDQECDPDQRGDEIEKSGLLGQVSAAETHARQEGRPDAWATPGDREQPDCEGGEENDEPLRVGGEGINCVQKDNSE